MFLNVDYNAGAKRMSSGRLSHTHDSRGVHCSTLRLKDERIIFFLFLLIYCFAPKSRHCWRHCS